MISTLPTAHSKELVKSVEKSGLKMEIHHELESASIAQFVRENGRERGENSAPTNFPVRGVGEKILV